MKRIQAGEVNFRVNNSGIVDLVSHEGYLWALGKKEDELITWFKSKGGIPYYRHGYSPRSTDQWVGVLSGATYRVTHARQDRLVHYEIEYLWKGVWDAMEHRFITRVEAEKQIAHYRTGTGTQEEWRIVRIIREVLA